VPQRHLVVQRHLSSSSAAVWELLADFPNLARHWDGLRATEGIGEQTRGVGARRRVHLKPLGSMEEVVTAWEEGHRIDTENHANALVPFKHATSSLRLEPDGLGTLATFDYRFVPRGGPVGMITGPLIGRMLTSTFNDMLEATDKAASAEQ
jgi:hypothetical protein